jgi:hypothetical protein
MTFNPNVTAAADVVVFFRNLRLVVLGSFSLMCYLRKTLASL